MPLAAELSRRDRPRASMSALVPGCGRAYDALALAEHGYSRVVALDISPAACEAAKEEIRASSRSSKSWAVAGGRRARYVGVFLDPSSVDELGAVLPPRHTNQTPQQHVTLLFEPGETELRSLPLLGTTCTMSIDAEAWDASGQAATVSLQDANVSALCTAGHTPHITLSCADGVEAKYSNELIASAELVGEGKRAKLTPLAKPLIVTGVLGVAVDIVAAAGDGADHTKPSRHILTSGEEMMQLLAVAAEPAAAEAAADESAEGVAAAATGFVNIQCADFFALDGRTKYDLIWDCTFLCALDPSVRVRWAEQMRSLLAPGGELLTAVFPIGDREGGPPYAMSVPLVRSLLEPVGFEAVVILDDLPIEEQHRRPTDALSSVLSRGTALVTWRMKP